VSIKSNWESQPSKSATQRTNNHNPSHERIQQHAVVYKMLLVEKKKGEF
jgi:hypothetical protein